MQLHEILTFRDDLYFDGAVQADWFYQPEKADAVASSFVFHGPATHAVSQSEVGGRGLMDTASFALKLAEKADGVDTGSPFTLAIAGYGTGKSHLAVALSTLFSGEDYRQSVHERILDNIKRADSEIANQIVPHVRRPRLVLTLNGMRDFNLHYELLRTAEKSLRINQASFEALTKLNKVKETAQHFLEHSYQLLQKQFNDTAKHYGIDERDDGLLAYLLMHLDDQDTVAFSVINDVYTAFNGHVIRVDEGVSAFTVLDVLLKECCGIHGQFESILILFDEFGRYLEYVAANPAAAGDSALQQMFEAVQNAQGDIQFVGFIQSDIKSYLQRVDKSSNISRYIDRYDAGEKVYFSSNLETIFANLLEHTDPIAYQEHILKRLQSEDEYWRALYDNMIKWLPLHGIWTKWEGFWRIIITAIYPLHPISTYLLCCLTDWLQNRSSLTLLSEKVKSMGDLCVDERLPMIYPVDLLKGSFFDELLSAEEQGRQRSQFCILLNNIYRKFDTKLSSDDKDVLLANLILRVCRFHFSTRSELNDAIMLCTNLSALQVQTALALLEDEYAVLAYDDRLICFDFVADSVGATDYRNFLRMAKNKMVFFPDLLQLEDVQNCADVINPIQTRFSTEFGIQTSEWAFEQQITHRIDMSIELIELYAKQLRSATGPNVPKGKLIWVYIEKNATSDQMEELLKLTEQIPTDVALCVFLLDDAENKLSDAILEYRTIINMSAEDKSRYHKFYEDSLMKAADRVTVQFDDMKKEKKCICNGEIKLLNTRISEELTEVYKTIYPKAVPFDFEGFNKKSISTSCKQFCAIMKWMLMENMKYQSYKALTIEICNRIESLLGMKGQYSWRAVNDNYAGVMPMNDRVRNVYNMQLEQLQQDRCLSFSEVVDCLTAAPYGMNDYAIFLLLALLSENLGHSTKLELDGQMMNCPNWADQVLSDKKIDMRQFARTTLHLVDIDECESRFRALFKEINNNVELNAVPILRKRLLQLEMEESVPEILASDHALASMRLVEGEKALYAYVNAIDSIQNGLENARVNHDAFSAMKAVISARNLADGKASMQGNYILNDTQLNEIHEYIDKGKMLAEKYLDEWIRKQRCGAIDRISTYEKHIHRVMDMMNSLGYLDQANMLRAWADKEIENTRIIAERMHIRQDCDSYLSTSEVRSGLTNETLTAEIERGMKIKAEFDSFDYQQSNELRFLYNDLSRRLAELQAAVKERRDQLNDVWDAIYSTDSVEDVRNVAARIRALLDTGLDDRDRSDLEEKLTVYTMFLQSITLLDDCGDNLEHLSDTRDMLQKQYHDGDDDNLIDIIDKVYQARIDQLGQKASAWAERWLSIEPSKMDENALEQWKMQTQPPPVYLQEDDVALYNKILIDIESILLERKIDYIVSLFGRLTVEEKVQCLEKLKSSM